MSQITIHIHPQLAEALLADGVDGARALGAVSRQAIHIVQACGRRIAYAPVILPNGKGCAMSARGGARGLIVEIDQPGTMIPGRGVVRETAQLRERGQDIEARRARIRRC